MRELSIPVIGEKIETIQVVKILVKPGDTVRADQPLLELETGKAVVEVPAPESGTVGQVLVTLGQDVTVGQVYATLEGATDVAAAPAPSPVAAAVPAAVAEPARTAGGATTGRPDARPSAEPVPGATAARADAGDRARVSAVEPATPFVPSAQRHVPAAPSVRRFARELGLDVDAVQGSGPRGRVSREDVMRHARELNARRGGPLGVSLPALPDFTAWGPIERTKMSAIRQQTAAHLALCWSLIPHVTIHDQADITQLEHLRKKYAARAEEAGGKLTMAVMVTKIVASALKKFPRFNASLDMEAREIVHKKYYHIGIAMATDRGLLVPVIRDADRKNMVTIAAEITALADRARKGQVKLEELKGGTFTITNLGRVGGGFFTPIVNYPEVAILGMGRTFREAAPEAGLAPRTILPLSLSFDHRLIDGADGAAFLRWIVEAIEEPLVLSLEG